jgi:sugar lactone lactonase YvrE
MKTKFNAFPILTSLLAVLMAGLALNADAQIYVTYSSRLDPLNTGKLGAYNLDGSPINPSLVSGLNYPWGLAADGAGSLYLANTGAGAGLVSKYTTSGSPVSSISTGPVMGVALDGRGSVYTFNYSFVVGKYTTSLATVNPSLINYSGGGFASIASDGDYLYVADTYDNHIAKYTTSGVLVNFGLITLPSNVGALSMACDGKGNLYVARNDNVVSLYTTSGTTLNAALITSGLDQPFSIALDGNGYLYVGNQRSGTIGKYTTSGVTINAALITGLDEPLGLAVVPEPSVAALAFAGLAFLLTRKVSSRAG